jgi:thiol-disulfide isomerase/thioredoxin
LQVRKLLAVIFCIPFLVGCGTSESSTGDTQTSYVAGNGAMTLLDIAQRGEVVQLSGITLDGAQLDLANYLGKVIVVNVWASWCGPCRAEAVELTNLSTEFANQDVQFIGLNTRDGLAAAQAFNKHFKTGYPSIQDQDGKLTLAFGKLGPAATPTTLVLDRSGRVAGRILGPVTETQLRLLINAVLEDG